MKQIDIEYLATNLGNLTGIPVRLYKDHKKVFFYSLTNLIVDPVKLHENEEMPGWLYMAKNNTGTIWEGWEGPNAQSGIASLNHYSKGAMVEWLFNGMCGINITGENLFLLKPIIGGKETLASASYDSIYGNIAISWKKEENKVIIDISVPGNTTALFVYKDVNEELKAGSYHYEFEG